MAVSISLIQPQVTIEIDGEDPQVLAAVDADTINARTPGATGLDLLETSTPEEVRDILDITDSEETLADAMAQVETMPRGPVITAARSPSSFGGFPVASLSLNIRDPLTLAAPFQG